MRWPQDATGWPHRERSTHVLSRPHRWHVQQMGRGPTLVLIHGAGGSTHSWRALMPLLAQNYHVVAIDLPGQGFSQSGARHRCGLSHMSDDVAALIVQQGWQVSGLIGHSAGAAIALELTGRLPRKNPPVVGINAALGNFPGVAGFLFPLMAKMLALNPLSASVFAKTAGAPGRVERLIEGTGSELSDEGLALYRRLITDRSHVDATLTMMSQWKLEPLLHRLSQITAPALLIVGENDRTVPAETSRSAADKLVNGTYHGVPNLGHLAHEEAPEEFAGLASRFFAEHISAA